MAAVEGDVGHHGFLWHLDGAVFAAAWSSLEKKFGMMQGG